MRRRDFLTLFGGGTAAWPLAGLRAAEQPDRTRTVGILMVIPKTDPQAEPRIRALTQGLLKFGLSDGVNVRLDYRWAQSSIEQIQTAATELIASKPDVLVAQGTGGLAAMRQQTSTIPIVFLFASDPTRDGWVSTWAHPGGNVTGFVSAVSALGSIWLQLLREVAPSTKKIIILFNSHTAPSAAFLPVIAKSATSLGITIVSAAVSSEPEINAVMAQAGQEANCGFVVLPDLFTTAHREAIIAAAAEQHLPGIYPYRFFTADGGLMSYGIDDVELYRQAASYIARILKGEQAADLPVQEPSKFELAINLKTAIALGLAVPQTLLGLADDVIE